MKQKTKLAFLIAAATASFGLALSASAQSAVAATSTPPPLDSGSVLLGSAFTGVAFRYTDLKGDAASALRGAEVTFNQPLRTGIDFNLNYDWGRASADPIRLTYQDLNAGATAFTQFAWGKPFVQALAGWEWRRGGGLTDNSFAYTLGTGVEFQVAQPVFITPYVNFVRATGFNRSEFDFGVKGTYRFTKQWSLTGGLEYDAISHSRDANVYTVGVNYHY